MENQKWEKFVRENWLVLIFAFLGLFLMISGISLAIRKQGGEEIVIESSQELVATESAKIKIEVSGAVGKPGVYELPPGSRVQDGLILAGGLSGNADREWVSQNLNLAAKLVDGGKIYIPDKTQNLKLKTQSYVQRLVSINTASQSELEALPGIGPVTAQKIIDGRPFEKIEELKTKKIVGLSVFEKIKERITLW